MPDAVLNAKTAIPAWLWDQNLELLAYLETIIEDPYLEAKLPPLPSSRIYSAILFQCGDRHRL